MCAKCLMNKAVWWLLAAGWRLPEAAGGYGWLPEAAGGYGWLPEAAGDRSMGGGTKALDTTLMGARGFDEYMNLVLDDAEEVSIKKKSRKPLGRILLKGDNITLMMNTGK
ncbi:hypothetical protein AgCh_009968 [Apium graveolens]